MSLISPVSICNLTRNLISHLHQEFDDALTRLSNTPSQDFDRRMQLLQLFQKFQAKLARLHVLIMWTAKNAEVLQEDAKMQSAMTIREMLFEQAWYELGAAQRLGWVSVIMEPEFFASWDVRTAISVLVNKSYVSLPKKISRLAKIKEEWNEIDKERIKIKLRIKLVQDAASKIFSVKIEDDYAVLSVLEDFSVHATLRENGGKLFWYILNVSCFEDLTGLQKMKLLKHSLEEIYSSMKSFTSSLFMGTLAIQFSQQNILKSYVPQEHVVLTLADLVVPPLLNFLGYSSDSPEVQIGVDMKLKLIDGGKNYSFMKGNSISFLNHKRNFVLDTALEEIRVWIFCERLKHLFRYMESLPKCLQLIHFDSLTWNESFISVTLSGENCTISIDSASGLFFLTFDDSKYALSNLTNEVEFMNQFSQIKREIFGKKFLKICVDLNLNAYTQCPYLLNKISDRNTIRFDLFIAFPRFDMVWIHIDLVKVSIELVFTSNSNFDSIYLESNSLPYEILTQNVLFELEVPPVIDSSLLYVANDLKLIKFCSIVDGEFLNELIRNSSTLLQESLLQAQCNHIQNNLDDVCLYTPINCTFSESCPTVQYKSHSSSSWSALFTHSDLEFLFKLLPNGFDQKLVSKGDPTLHWYPVENTVEFRYENFSSSSITTLRSHWHMFVSLLPILKNLPDNFVVVSLSYNHLELSSNIKKAAPHFDCSLSRFSQVSDVQIPLVDSKPCVKIVSIVDRYSSVGKAHCVHFMVTIGSGLILSMFSAALEVLFSRIHLNKESFSTKLIQLFITLSSHYVSFCHFEVFEKIIKTMQKIQSQANSAANYIAIDINRAKIFLSSHNSYVLNISFLSDSEILVNSDQDVLKSIDPSQLIFVILAWYKKAAFSLLLHQLETNSASYHPDFLRVSNKIVEIDSWTSLIGSMGLRLESTESPLWNMCALKIEDDAPILVLKEIKHSVIKTFFSMFLSKFVQVNFDIFTNFIKLLSLPWPYLGDVISLFEQQLRCFVNGNFNDGLKFRVSLEKEVTITKSTLSLSIEFQDVSSLSLPLTFDLNRKLCSIIVTGFPSKLLKNFQGETEFICRSVSEIRKRSIADLYNLLPK